MKSALQVRKENLKSNSLNGRAGDTASKSPEEMHLLSTMKRITDPTTRYAVSMLVACLTSGFDPEDRKARLQTYFDIIRRRVPC